MSAFATDIDVLLQQIDYLRTKHEIGSIITFCEGLSRTLGPTADFSSKLMNHKLASTALDVCLMISNMSSSAHISNNEDGINFMLPIENYTKTLSKLIFDVMKIAVETKDEEIHKQASNLWNDIKQIKPNNGWSLGGPTIH